mgnify:CR=1 FL=1
MSANTKIVVLRRKELLYTGIFAALGVLFVILLLMLLLPGKAADTSGTPDSPDSTAETVMPDNVADLGRIPQSAQTEDVSTGPLPIPMLFWIMLPGLSVLIIHISRGSTPRS